MMALRMTGKLLSTDDDDKALNRLIQDTEVESRNTICIVSHYAYSRQLILASGLLVYSMTLSWPQNLV